MGPIPEDNALTLSRLYDRIGARDSGDLDYALANLRGSFLERTETVHPHRACGKPAPIGHRRTPSFEDEPVADMSGMSDEPLRIRITDAIDGDRLQFTLAEEAHASDVSPLPLDESWTRETPHPAAPITAKGGLGGEPHR